MISAITEFRAEATVEFRICGNLLLRESRMKTFSKMPGTGEELRYISCPLCGSTVFKRKWCIDGAIFVRCRGCNLVVQNPQPTSFGERYDEKYFEYEIANQKNFLDLMLKGLDDAAFFEDIVPTLPAPRRILDIGCATGRLLYHFKGLGWDTAGVDLCVKSAAYGNREYGVNIISKSLEDTAFPGAFFSVVHSSHLIEHVADPGELVREVARILLPCGVFICVTPTLNGLQARIFGSWWRSAIPDHMTLFSKATLIMLLKDAGFEIELVRTWGGIAKGMAPGWLKRQIDRIAKRFNFGDVLLVVARRLKG